MPYSDPIDPLTPPDTEPVHLGDDRIRELKRALIQRLESVFQDVDQNPLVPRRTVFGRPYAVRYDSDEIQPVQQAGVAERVLAMEVKGTTGATGAITVSLDQVNSATGESFNLAQCVSIVATLHPPRTPHESAVGWDPGFNFFTLRCAEQTEDDAHWSVMLAFRQ